MRRYCYNACYFCCCFDTQSPDDAPDYQVVVGMDESSGSSSSEKELPLHIEEIVLDEEVPVVHRPVYHHHHQRGLNVRRIGQFLRDIASCRHHEMDQVAAWYWAEIDRLIDETDDLHSEIKETLKAFYRIRDARERAACLERIAFLCDRWQQQIRYDGVTPLGETFATIIHDDEVKRIFYG
jgi:hypothetical protein